MGANVLIGQEVARCAFDAEGGRYTADTSRRTFLTYLGQVVEISDQRSAASSLGPKLSEICSGVARQAGAITAAGKTVIRTGLACVCTML